MPSLVQFDIILLNFSSFYFLGLICNVFIFYIQDVVSDQDVDGDLLLGDKGESSLNFLVSDKQLYH